MAEDVAHYIAHAEHLVQLGQLDRAADSYVVALRFEARSLVALCGLTSCQLRAGNLDEARRTLARALEVDERHPKVMKLQAELSAKSGRFDLFVEQIAEVSEQHARRHKRR